MNPVLFNAAARLAPMLQRFGTRVGTLGAPSLLQRYMMGGSIPQPQVSPVTPPAPSNAPSPPISSSNFGTPPSNQTPNSRVANGFDVFNPYMTPKQAVSFPGTPAAPQAPSGSFAQQRPNATPQAPTINSNGSIAGAAGPTSVGGAPLMPQPSQATQQPSNAGPSLIQKMLALLQQNAGTSNTGSSVGNMNPADNTFS